MVIRDIQATGSGLGFFCAQQVCASSHGACSKAQGFYQEQNPYGVKMIHLCVRRVVLTEKGILGQDGDPQPFGVVHSIAAFTALFFHGSFLWVVVF